MLNKEDLIVGELYIDEEGEVRKLLDITEYSPESYVLSFSIPHQTCDCNWVSYCFKDVESWKPYKPPQEPVRVYIPAVIYEEESAEWYVGYQAFEDKGKAILSMAGQSEAIKYGIYNPLTGCIEDIHTKGDE